MVINLFDINFLVDDQMTQLLQYTQVTNAKLWVRIPIKYTKIILPVSFFSAELNKMYRCEPFSWVYTVSLVNIFTFLLILQQTTQYVQDVTFTYYDVIRQQLTFLDWTRVSVLELVWLFFFNLFPLFNFSTEKGSKPRLTKRQKKIDTRKVEVL